MIPRIAMAAAGVVVMASSQAQTWFRAFEQDELRPVIGSSVGLTFAMDSRKAESPNSHWITGSIEPSIGWTELVLSWEAETPAGSCIEVLVAPEPSTPMSFGMWSTELGLTRTSLKTQKANGSALYTDTLIREAQTWGYPDFFVRLQPNAQGEHPTMKRLFVSAIGPATTKRQLELSSIEPLNVPQRCQGDYPGGGVLCSPTSLSMVLTYWGSKLERKELNRDVPEVQAGVHDPGWGGTGNWPFNTAYAASLPGMTGYVTRLRDFGDIMLWLEREVPVVTSISYDLLKGKSTKGENDGHLIVVVGFDAASQTVIVNDPGRNAVRLQYPLEHFLRAWASSKHTVYLVYPENWVEPRSPGGPWMHAE